MKTVLTVIVTVLVLYLLFVAFNSYIYAEEQGEGSFLQGSAQIQWGF